MQLAVEAMGAVTAVGDNLPLSVASIYTNARHCQALASAGPGPDGRPVIGAPALLGDDVQGVDRLRVLAMLALQECAVDRLALPLPLPLIVCAPPLDLFGCDANWLLRRLSDDADLAIDLDASRVFATGRGTLPDALDLAGRLLSSQEWPACFLVGVDSLVVPARLTRELVAGRVAGPGNATGFVPGEAGAALLLSLRADGGGLADIVGVGRCEDGAPAAILNQAIDQALAGARVAATALSAICHDGPGDWAQLEELALADGRPPLSQARQAQRLIPAISTGEVGAAAGVLSLAVAGLLLSRGVLQRPVLAMFAAEGPPRGAAVVTPAAPLDQNRQSQDRQPNDRRQNDRLNDGQAGPDGSNVLSTAMVGPDAPARVASVSVDLDPLECYFRIHALEGMPSADVRFAILRRCLPRFRELFARHNLRATFFVVGRDLEEDQEGRALLVELAREGHELANHSYSHPYDLVRLGPVAIASEIDRAHGAIAACAGTPPVGFRAPGYEVSADVIDLLRARGYRYDSSAFPSVPYYGAKAAIMGLMQLVGRKSGSFLGSPRVVMAPRRPYRPAAGAPYREGELDIVELPMAVTPWLRWPVIGTSLITVPAWMRGRMVAAALREPFFNLELHGIDLCDADADRIPAELVARQADLRRPLALKLAALDATLSQVTAGGGTFQRLAEVASHAAATV